MQWRGWRIPLVILAFVLGLLFLFGAQWLYNKYSYQEPLARVLKADAAVESYTIQKQGAVLNIEVQLKETPDLGTTYRRLRQSIQGVLDARPFTLKLKDNRDEELKKAYYYSQFALYEAQMWGNYREMIRFVEEEAAKVKASVSVSLDQDNIYLHMKHGNHYLYEVIPRKVLPATPAPSTALSG